MRFSDSDSVMDTDRLLGKEHSSVESVPAESCLKVSPRKRHWADPTRLQISLFIHLTLIAIYTVAFSLTVDHIVRRYEHGPDLIYCKIGAYIYINNGRDFTDLVRFSNSTCKRCGSIRKEIYQ